MSRFLQQKGPIRRKSFISPCKQINTEEMFRKSSRCSAHCRAFSVEQQDKTSSSMQFGRNTGRDKLLKGQFTIPRSTRNKKGHFLRISQLINGMQEIQQEDNTYKQVVFPFKSHERMSSTFSKELKARPSTSNIQALFSEISDRDPRPATNALNVRIKKKTSTQRMSRSVTVEQHLPIAQNKIYIPKIWKRLVALRKKKRRVQHIDSFVICGKAT